MFSNPAIRRPEASGLLQTNYPYGSFSPPAFSFCRENIYRMNGNVLDITAHVNNPDEFSSFSVHYFDASSRIERIIFRTLSERISCAWFCEIRGSHSGRVCSLLRYGSTQERRSSTLMQSAWAPSPRWVAITSSTTTVTSKCPSFARFSPMAVVSRTVSFSSRKHPSMNHHGFSPSW